MASGMGRVRIIQMVYIIWNRWSFVSCSLFRRYMLLNFKRSSHTKDVHLGQNLNSSDKMGRLMSRARG